MSKHYASVADRAEKAVSFREIARGCYAFTAEGDPNSGVIVGDDCVLVIDAQPGPAMAGKVVEHIRKITDKPIRHVVLTHYHASHTLGVESFGAPSIIASDLSRRIFAERGKQNREAERERFPRLFASTPHNAAVSPTLTFSSSVSLFLGSREVRIMHLGRGHTMGDIVVWVPDCRAMFTGDLVANRCASYCGDAHIGDWPRTLDRLKAFHPEVLVPGRGAVAISRERCAEVLEQTKSFIEVLRDAVNESVEHRRSLKDAFLNVRHAMDNRFGSYALYEHFLPFSVARAYDEAQGVDHPRIWTAKAEHDLWRALVGEGEVAESVVEEETAAAVAEEENSDWQEATPQEDWPQEDWAKDDDAASDDEADEETETAADDAAEDAEADETAGEAEGEASAETEEERKS